MNIVYGHKQAAVYYHSGIEQFDKVFGNENYIKCGYICTLMANTNAISICCVRFNSIGVGDMGVAHINKNSILSFEEFESNHLEVVKVEALKHQAKALFKKGFGLLGAVTGMVAEQFTNVNTHHVTGVTFILNYTDSQSVKKSITLYSSEEDQYLVRLFLASYFEK